MRRNWKTISLALVGTVFLFGGLWASPAAAQRFETVYTGPNNDVAYGVRDNATGVIWGKTITLSAPHFDPVNVELWQAGENAKLEEEGGISLADGRTDWRMPTVAEVIAAHDRTKHASGHNLADEIALFDFSYEDGFQGVDDPVVEGKPQTWRERYYMTACLIRQGQRLSRYVFRLSDGDYFLQWGGAGVLPVRRDAEENHDSCPHRTKPSPDKNPNKK